VKLLIVATLYMLYVLPSVFATIVMLSSTLR